MISWYNPDCADGIWEKAGWWGIDPGGSAVVYNDDLDDVNKYWYFYAQADDGAYWVGPYPESARTQAFDWCPDIGQTNELEIGMRQLAIDGGDHTVTFVA